MSCLSEVVRQNDPQLRCVCLAKYIVCLHFILGYADYLDLLSISISAGTLPVFCHVANDSQGRSQVFSISVV